MGRTLLTLVALEDRTVPAGLYPGATTQYLTGLATPANTAITTAAPIASQQLADGSIRIVTGASPGQLSNVSVQTQAGQVLFSTDPFGGFTGGVRVATGDVNGDGNDDIGITAGSGGGARVQIRDGLTFSVISDEIVIDPQFRGGYYLELADVNHDGYADVLGMAGEGGGPRVTIISGFGLTHGSFTVMANFFGFEAGLRDGGTITSADVNDDGYGDIIIAPGAGGGPRVRVIDAFTLLSTGQIVTHADFFAADPNSRFGVNVTAGNLGVPCGAAVLVTFPRQGDTDYWIRVFNPIGGNIITSAGFTEEPKMGALGTIVPAHNAGETPRLLVSAWKRNGDIVQSYPLLGYDYDEWDCAPIVVDPPSPPPPPTADLHIHKVADRGTAQIGETVTFTLTVRNDGPASATSVLVSDPLTAGFVYQSSSASVGAYDALTGRWSLGDLANGATGVLTITTRVTSSGNLTNTATASSAIGDPDPLDNTATASVTAVPPSPPPAPTLIPLSATGLHYLAAPGTFTPISDVNVGNTTTSPVVVHRLVFVLNTGHWSDVANIKLQLLGSLSSEPGMGSITIDPLGTILTINDIGYTLATGVVALRLSGDVSSTVQVGTVTAWGYSS